MILAPAGAEGVDLNGLNGFAREHGFDARGFMARWLAGEGLTIPTSPEEILSAVRNAVRADLYGPMLNLMLPTVACVLVRLVAGHGGTDFMMNLLCALCCASTLTGMWTQAWRQLTEMMELVLGAMEKLTPAMASVSALSGGVFWSSAAGTLSGLGGMIIGRVLRDWGLKLCAGAAAMALCCAVAGRYALDRLFDLLKTAVRWMLCASVFAFGGLMSAQGAMGAAKDGAAMKAARTAIESVIPIIGAGVSDSAGSLMASAGVAKSAIGITGVALMAKLCLAPLLKIGAEALALKLTSAMLEPLADGAASELIGRFGEILEMMLAIGVCSGIVAATLPACFAATAGALF